MKTGDVLQAMLTENTGTHMLDSGGAYGRAWQQNKGRDFASEPAATISVEEGFIDIRRSTFYFLAECLEFDESMTLGFEQFCKVTDPKDQMSWLALMEEFTESSGYTGVYGEGKPIVINTHNDKNRLLEEVLQYIYFELDEQGYVLLHLGSKLHTAYTTPKAFRCNIDNYPSIFTDAEAQITCKGEEYHRWYVQEGSWEVDHYESADARFLTEFPIITGKAKYYRLRKEAMIAEGAAFGVIWQDGDGVHCPLCGEILEVW